MTVGRLRRPSPGVVLAALALVVALSGSAVGASLITSKQIKNGTIRISDLSPSARAALKGRTGPIGPKGDAGVGGLQGSRGAEGVPGRTGAAGPTGPTGETGPDGSSGKAAVVEATRDPVQAFGTTPVTIATLTLPHGSGWMVQARTEIRSGQTNIDNLVTCYLRFRSADGLSDYYVDQVSAYMGANQPGDVGYAPFPFLGVLGSTQTGSTLSVLCVSSATPSPSNTLGAARTTISAIDATSASSQAVTG